MLAVGSRSSLSLNSHERNLRMDSIFFRPGTQEVSLRKVPGGSPRSEEWLCIGHEPGKWRSRIFRTAMEWIRQRERPLAHISYSYAINISYSCAINCRKGVSSPRGFVNESKPPMPNVTSLIPGQPLSKSIHPLLRILFVPEFFPSRTNRHDG